MKDKVKKPNRRKYCLKYEDYAVHGWNICCTEWEEYVSYIQQIVIEDVPHKYQERLLRVLGDV